MFIVEGKDFVAYLLRAFLLGASLSPLFLFSYTIEAALSSFGKVGRRLSFAVLFLYDVISLLFSCGLNILMVFAANRGQVRPIALLMELAGFLLLFLPFKGIAKRAQIRAVQFFFERLLVPFLAGFSRLIKGTERKIAKKIKVNKLERYGNRFEKKARAEIEREIQNAKRELFSEE